MTTAYGTLPGVGSTVETPEKAVYFGRYEQQVFLSNMVIDSTAVDAGNSPTTTLRAGLLLGKKTSDGNLYAWNPDATDGTEVIYGVLGRETNMLGANGAVEDKVAGDLLVGGFLIASALLVEGTAFTSSTLEHLARKQLTSAGRFLLSDDLVSRAAFLGGSLQNKTVITDTTVTAADNGTRFFATTADCDFTLPTLEEGLVFEFVRASDHEMAVISAAGDDVIVGNDLSADSVTFTTASEQIGAAVRVEGVNVGGTLKWWMTLPQAPFGTAAGSALTIAIATA